MQRLSFERFKLSPEDKRVLKEVVITENGPGTILKDFNIFLDYLGERDLPVAGTHQLPRLVLPEINGRLNHPLEIRLMRPQQKSYPHIQGLHLLARASGLICVGGAGRKPVLSVDKETNQSWRSLNPTERYFNLLETWLLQGKPEIVGERGGGSFLSNNFQGWMYLFEQIPKKGFQVSDRKDAESSLRYVPRWHNLALLEMFGLILIRHGSPEEAKGWKIERIERTPFGDALLALLYSRFFRIGKDIQGLMREGMAPIGVLQPVLQPYFTDWKNNLSFPKWVFREGTYIFKVSLGRIWLRIAIPANRTLDSLASFILNAVDFDYDHLYHFEYENPFGVLERVNHPYIDEGPWADEVRVGDVPLRVGQTITYLYDFGDNWEFKVTLDQIDSGRMVQKTALLERHGNPPEQYPSWDD